MQEAIARYHGDIESALQEKYGENLERGELYFELLLQNYIVFRAEEELLREIARLEEINYLEGDDPLFFQGQEENLASCIYSNSMTTEELTGEGVIVAVIDRGIDFYHPEFLNGVKEQKESRFIVLWEQKEIGERYRSQIKYTEEINAMLNDKMINRQGKRTFMSDSSGHGTAVMGIAAGNTGVAKKADLLGVKMEHEGTISLVRGVDFALRTAMEKNKPVVINISYGYNNGAHTGDSLIETYLENVAGIASSTIVVSMGNEGDKGHFIERKIVDGQTQLEFSVASYETEITIRLWKELYDQFSFWLQLPGGEMIDYGMGINKTNEIGNTRILFSLVGPTPYERKQEMILKLQTVEENASDQEVLPGIWKLFIRPVKVVSGIIQCWLTSERELSTNTFFLSADRRGTIMVPATARRVISVGAYDITRRQMASFSSLGNTSDGRQKPDLVAPGVGIRAPKPGAGYQLQSGTSFSAPFVAGAVALMNEWGIIRGNDIFLYGEKAKAFLIAGAKPLPSATSVPSVESGFGALCFQGTMNLT